MAGMIAVVATSFCLTGTMADGSHTRRWSAAHNGYPLGTRIWIDPAVFGRHRWVVRDRIGFGTQLDFWSPSCATSRRFGRRVVKVHRGWPVVRARRTEIKRLPSLAYRGPAFQ